jgi:prevent-host-death family protein
MAKVGVRELRQHASRYIERARAGETIEVTMRGLIVARLVPPAGDGWSDLVNAGRVRPPSGTILDAAAVSAPDEAIAEVRAAQEEAR